MKSYMSDLRRHWVEILGLVDAGPSPNCQRLIGYHLLEG
jgi:hypothetical protein